MMRGIKNPVDWETWLKKKGKLFTEKKKTYLPNSLETSDKLLYDLRFLKCC